MIGGFNTDIVLDGVVYHVQTEDKGSKTQEIVTQIFREGAVIFTRRSPYPTTDGQAPQDSVLAAQVREQHVRLLQFVRSGGLKQKEEAPTAPPPPAETQVPPPGGSAPETVPTRPTDEPEQPSPAAAVLEKTRSFGKPLVSALRRSRGKTLERVPAAPPQASAEGPAAPDEGQAPSGSSREELEVPEPAPSPQAPAPEQRTAELVIEDFLQDLGRVGGRAHQESTEEKVSAGNPTAPPPTVPAAEDEAAESAAGAPDAKAVEPPAPVAVAAFREGERCEIQLLSSSTILSGEVQPLSVRVQSDVQQLAIPDARVVVKVYGKTIRPITYSGLSDARGVFSVEMLVPHYTVGDGHVEIEAQTVLGVRWLRLDVTCSPASK